MRSSRSRRRSSIDQLLLVAPLERAVLLAHRGLRDEVQLGSSRETPGFHQVTEGLERFELH
jgi:hypothetical protein